MKKHKKQKKNHKTILTAKKHWVVYVVPTLIIVAGIVLMNGAGDYFTAIGGLVSATGFYMALKKANDKWHLTEQYLVIEKGLLPWSKEYQEISVNDIYKSHTNPSRLSKYFKTGHLNTRRRSDDCSGLNNQYLANHEEFSRALQLQVQKLPGNNLNQAFELKERGAISEKEYNLIKLGYVTQQHLSKF